jgi:hypothetical protein
MFGTFSADTQKWFDQNQTRRSAKPISTSSAASSLALISLMKICRSTVVASKNCVLAGGLPLLLGALGDDGFRAPRRARLEGGA